ncbi:unnamed protein product [Vitrella brassicaformis CCMP3155]|uniref:Transcription initiation factor TFIID subunit 2 n=4 Tax=Vitrella brassicaformis TaxID=1169539 RepID=A0A0G4GGX3_VITBC|nr:unnamed protein product [Vitrella brassicaformis CCMP3155]|eukprot:CEM28885.1 unnamed protein product [Vitrella brassicaformis CCMP3155]
MIPPNPDVGRMPLPGSGVFRTLVAAGTAVGVGLYAMRRVYKSVQQFLRRVRAPVLSTRVDPEVDAEDALRQKEASFRTLVVQEVAYDIVLWMKEGCRYAGEANISFTHRCPTQGIFLDFSGGAITCLCVNGRLIGSDGVAIPSGIGDVKLVESGHAVWAAHRLQISGSLLKEHNEVVVVFASDYDRTGAGLHQIIEESEQQVFEYYCANPGVFETHRIFPCFDQPDLRAQLRLSVIAPSQWTVITNMPPLEVSADALQTARRERMSAPASRSSRGARAYAHTSASGGVSGLVRSMSGDLLADEMEGETQRCPTIFDDVPKSGCKLWRFGATPPISLSGFVFAVGPFLKVVNKTEGGLPVALYCRQSQLRYLDHADLFELISRGLRFFEQYFDTPYPFQKYDQVFVPQEALMATGGTCSPRAGATMLVESLMLGAPTPEASSVEEAKLFRARVILENIVWVWLGGMVSVSWWSEEWLPEAFSSYAAALALSDPKMERTALGVKSILSASPQQQPFAHSPPTSLAAAPASLPPSSLPPPSAYALNEVKRVPSMCSTWTFSNPTPRTLPSPSGAARPHHGGCSALLEPHADRGESSGWRPHVGGGGGGGESQTPKAAAASGAGAGGGGGECVETEATLSWVVFHRDLKAWAYSQDQKVTAHALYSMVRDTHDLLREPAISRGKGAAVFKQLVCLLGQEPFRLGLALFFARFRFQSVTIKQFFQVLQEGCVRMSTTPEPSLHPAAAAAATATATAAAAADGASQPPPAGAPGAPAAPSVSGGSGVGDLSYGRCHHEVLRAQSTWMKVWLGKPGINTIRPRWVCGPAASEMDGRDTRVLSLLQLQQTAPVKQPTMRPHRLRVDLFYPSETEAGKVDAYGVWVDVTDELTNVPSVVGLPPPLGVLCNAGDYAYVKGLLDEQTLEFVSERLQHIQSVLSRQLIWRSLWEMVRDRQLSSLRFLELVLANWGVEPNLCLLEGLASNVLAALHYFIPEPFFMEVAGRLSDATRELTEKAQQQQQNQTFIDFWLRLWCHTSYDLAHLRPLLALMDSDTPPSTTTHLQPPQPVAQPPPAAASTQAAQPPAAPETTHSHSHSHNHPHPQLHLDQALRWKVLEHFCALTTEADEGSESSLEDGGPLVREREERLRREGERDPPTTPTGAIGHAKCYAAIPDAKQKNQISTLNLHDISASMASFHQRHPCQRHLLAPYVKLFFKEVRRVFRCKHPHLALQFWEQLFPLHRVANSSRTLARTLRLIEALGEVITDEKLLRRVALDGYDELLRAHACREMCWVQSGTASLPQEEQGGDLSDLEDTD